MKFHRMLTWIAIAERTMTDRVVGEEPAQQPEHAEVDECAADANGDEASELLEGRVIVELIRDAEELDDVA